MHGLRPLGVLRHVWGSGEDEEYCRPWLTEEAAHQQAADHHISTMYERVLACMHVYVYEYEYACVSYHIIAYYTIIYHYQQCPPLLLHCTNKHNKHYWWWCRCRRWWCWCWGWCSSSWYSSDTDHRSLPLIMYQQTCKYIRYITITYYFNICIFIIIRFYYFILYEYHKTFKAIDTTS